MTRHGTVDLMRTTEATISAVDAGRLLGIGRTKTFEMIKAGAFPVPVLRLGRDQRVSTYELRRYLGADIQASA